MKFLKFSSFLALYCLSLSAYSEYQVKLPLTDKYGLSINQSWIPESPLVSNWLNYNNPYDCTSWTPDASTIDEGASFTQTQANCKQDQTRTITSRETNKVTGETRTIDTVTETQTVLVSKGSFTQKAIGTRSIIGCYYDLGDIGGIKSHVEFQSDKYPGNNKDKRFYYKGQFIGSLHNTYNTGIYLGKYVYYMGNLKKTMDFYSFKYEYYEICIRNID